MDILDRLMIRSDPDSRDAVEEIRRLRKWQTDMVQKAAEKRLEGYREMADLLAEKDEVIDRLRREIKNMEKFYSK